MSTLKITRYTIQFKALTAMQLPDYAGSTLRGAFGHALKSIACLTAQRNKGICKCNPIESCLYRQLFDPTKRELKTQERVQDIPPPFIIEAHGLPGLLKSGQVAKFYMVLIGEMAHQQLMMIQFAWQRALAIGFGTQLSNGGIQAELQSFSICDHPKLLIAPQSSCRLSLVTHARLQHQGNFLKVENFDVKTFCWAIFRRYLTIAEIYSDLTVNDALKQKIFKDIQLVDGKFDVEWVKWSRYSNRQKQRMDLDGLRGTIELTGLSDELYYYLYLGQWLHTGKGCVFGLGQYSLR